MSSGHSDQFFPISREFSLVISFVRSSQSGEPPLVSKVSSSLDNSEDSSGLSHSCSK